MALLSIALLCNDSFLLPLVISVFKNLFKSNPGTGHYPEYLQVSRRKVKWARLQVFPNGEVQMVVPKHYREKDIRQLLEAKQNWIDKKREKYQRPVHEVFGIAANQLLLFGKGYDLVQSGVQLDQAKNTVDHEQRRVFTTKDFTQKEVLENWYRKLAKTYLTQQIEALALEHNFEFNRLFIRAQRTRWGSCSSAKNISLNWRLIKAPESVSRYVILHELTHTRIMNHSAAFWDQVAKVAPDYQESKAWLTAHGSFL